MKLGLKQTSCIVAGILAGVFLFVVALPAGTNPAGVECGAEQRGTTLPRAAAFTDYLYTIGTTGSSGAGNNQLNNPLGVGVNSTGYTYVADTFNNRVQVFDSAGTYQYTIGTGTSGSGNNQFSTPRGVAVNSTGYAYVADLGNNRVQVFNSAGTYQYTIGTGFGSGPYQFSSPRGVAVNSTGYAYVVDTFNNRVQVFDRAGTYQYTIGTGTSGSGNNQFTNPSGVAVNSTGYLYVADMNNYRVQVFDCAGTYQYTIGTGTHGSGSYQFENPIGVAVNSTGFVYVADTGNNRVQVFDRAGTYQNTIGGGPGAGNNQFFDPSGVAVNSTGNLYVADSSNDRVQVFGCQLPALAISISGGAADTPTTSVTLALSAAHADDMSFSNDNVTWSAWESFAPTKAWVLTGTSGPKTVYCKVRNGPYEAYSSANITYTLQPVVYFTINDGAAMTTSHDVTLSIATFYATEMCFSNDNVTWFAWESPAATKTWMLPGGSGLKTVYCKVHNNTLTTIGTANITYAAPLLPVPTIWHAGNITTYTNQTGATVSWVISGSNVTGITTTVYRNDAAVAWGPWTSGSPVSVSLDGLAPGTYNFTIVATDMFGDTARDTTFVTVIASQTAPVPAVPVIWHAGNVTVYTNQTGVMVSWVISGSNASGNTVTIFRNGTPVAWGPWTPSLPISISLDGLAPGTYIFTVVATDSFGNTAQDTAFVTVVASQAAPASPADISASTWVVLIVGAIEGIVFSVAVVIMVVSLKRSRAGNARVIPATMTGDRELNSESDSTEE